MNTYEIAFGNSYPHFYTLNGKDDKVQSNPIMLSGTADITGAYLNSQTLALGDKIVISKVEHVITEIIETREAKGQHYAPATFYHVKASYIRNRPNV